MGCVCGLVCTSPLRARRAEVPSRSSSPAPLSPPLREKKIQAAGSPKATSTSRHSKSESKKLKSTIKAKGKAKAVAAVAAEGGEEDVDMEDGDRGGAAGAAEEPERAEEDESGEEELEDAEERKTASKKCVCDAHPFSLSLLTLSVAVRKQLWTGGTRWMWRAGKSATRMSFMFVVERESSPSLTPS